MRLQLDVQITGIDGLDKATPDDIQNLVKQFEDAARKTLPQGAHLAFNLERVKHQVGMLVYYKRVPVPDTFPEPTRGQYEDFCSLQQFGSDVDVTYEEFCALCERTYQQSKELGYGVAIQSKAVEYKDNDHLEQVKDKLREEEDFLGFPDDDIIQEIITPIDELVKQIRDGGSSEDS